uniref:Secreted protein n=1 Tax=Parastrongyloides trichosuri TaxID=131310 RepID=A0A0N4ZZU5_PARTI
MHATCASVARGPGQDRLRRPGHWRAVGGRAQARDDAHPGARHPQAAGPGAALPDGRWPAGGPGRGCRTWRGHVRLRDADPQCAQRLAVHPLRRRQDPQRQVPRRHPPAGPQLQLPHLREFLARLPAPSAARQ